MFIIIIIIGSHAKPIAVPVHYTHRSYFELTSCIYRIYSVLNKKIL